MYYGMNAAMGADVDPRDRHVGPETEPTSAFMEGVLSEPPPGVPMPGPLRAYRDGSLGQENGKGPGAGAMAATALVVLLFIGVPELLSLAGGGRRRTRS